MNVVGKVGSLITQGVYSVATPFHPFGGAVDIIVVQQQDGSFRSTPWYVQFGKFQGVLKGAEKMVQIKVNGIEANFHMHLDNSGEAYFVREAVSIENGEEKQVLKDEREPTLEYSFSVDNSQCTINNENIENFRLQSTLSDPGVLSDNYSSFNRLERNDSDACRFYDFQDDQSFDDSMELSSEYGSNPYENMEVVENFVEAHGSDSEMVLVSVDGHILTAPISSSEHNTEIVQLDTPQFHLGPGKGNGFCEEDKEFTVSETTWDSQYLNDLEDSSIKPGSSGNNNVDLHQGLSNTVKIEEHTSVNQESDGKRTQLSEVRHDEGANKIYELESCEENRELTHREIKPSVVCVNSRNSLCKSEESGEMSEHEAGGDEKILHEDGGVEDTHLPEGLDDEACAHRDEDDNCNKLRKIESYIHSDIEDTSPSSKNEDKFRSCLDLTSAGVDETLESEVSTLETQEEAESMEDMQFPTEISGDGGSITNTNMGGVVDSSLSLVSENEKRVHKDNTFTPTENVSVCNEEPAALNPSVKIDISNESEDPKQHTGSSPKRIETNLNPTIEISLCRHLLRPGMGLAAADEAFNAHRLSEDDFRSTALSLIKNENLIIRYNGKYLPWEQAAPIVLGMAAFGVKLPIESDDAIPVEQEVTSNAELPDSGSASGRRWRLWPIPFRRVKTLPRSTSNTSEEVFVDSESVSRSPSINLTPTSESGTPRSATSSKSPLKKIVRTNIPTNEQISSLNLKEGQNDVTFSFSTRVLGLQQVEAHIYLWKWNARIVISDVDGTITRSDVLGQFMPLVGKDWSQSGVARLFSAIKENGYQLLFLSARAIVQAYLTKSFLFNLKQDGKTLPNGPVVISPNGLFPSLYREVIRRAPHEFKIACLEDIKALFPPDYNPFYAGFGNRDTDELTYKKIGIPKGKIFIINPKGEVAINHRIDVKSYTSLHTLVNDMFPPTSMVEQEDYNAWNFWKMPLPDIDD
ncbi:unnamed protein product [Amaranthus hypochondriacus]